jgi:hypothetical protein
LILFKTLSVKSPRIALISAKVRRLAEGPGGALDSMFDDGEVSGWR